MYIFKDEGNLIAIPESMTTAGDEERHVIPLAATPEKAELFRRWYRRQTGRRASRVSMGRSENWQEILVREHGAEAGPFGDAVLIVERVWTNRMLHGTVISIDR